MSFASKADVHYFFFTDYALQAHHQPCVDLIVNAGVQAELIFSTLGKSKVDATGTKTEYLEKPVRYVGESLLDEDDRGVMMEWERPIMDVHAQLLCEKKGDVLNVGFGLGCVDNAIQSHAPKSHTIIEAHPDVYAKMIADGWDKKPNVRIFYGRWQDVIKTTEFKALNGFDSVFFDTFDDVACMKEFHSCLPDLVRPGGLYSWWNGVCPENIIFQGVACEVLKQHLASLGFATQYLTCEINSDTDAWKDTKFRYYARSDYFLPMATHVGRT